MGDTRQFTIVHLQPPGTHNAQENAPLGSLQEEIGSPWLPLWVRWEQNTRQPPMKTGSVQLTTKGPESPVARLGKGVEGDVLRWQPDADVLSLFACLVLSGSCNVEVGDHGPER